MTDDFERFWNRYPRKVGKLVAQRAWNRHKPVLATVLSALDWQCRQPQWLKDGGQFIPHPATWLNQGRWDDLPFELPREEAETHSQMIQRVLRESRDQIRH